MAITQPKCVCTMPSNPPVYEVIPGLLLIGKLIYYKDFFTGHFYTRESAGVSSLSST